MQRMVFACLWLACAGLPYLSSNLLATEPKSSAPMKSVRLEVFPAEIELVDARHEIQLVVTGHDESDRIFDVTHRCTVKPVDQGIARMEGLKVRPVADGLTELLITYDGQEIRTPIRVQGAAKPRPIAFENEVLVALSKQGCNSGACHGSPSGKGGFRLSLRAFDANLDSLTLTQEEFGRRLNLIEPDRSLLLEKPLMKVAHGGGLQMREHQLTYKVLREWVAEGARLDPPQTARVQRIELFPSQRRVLMAPHHQQQVAVLAHFADGTKRDVTSLCAFSSSNMNVATIDDQGLVQGLKRGESAILVRFLEHIETLPLMFVDQRSDFQWPSVEAASEVDRLVDIKLRQLQYLPADRCNDSEFLRRVYLDITGLLPPVEVARRFLENKDPLKRSQLIDQLLDQPEYAKFWALKWGDWLRLTSKRIGDDAVFKYHRWIENAIRDNMPYDQFARELLSASGSNLVNPPANFYRTATDTQECVETFSQVFLGARLQCAKCHNHPFERWTQDNYYGLAAFFDRVQRKKTARAGETFVWYNDSGEVVQPRTGQSMKPWLPVQGSQEIPNEQDRRGTLVEWLTQSGNPFFAKMEVNRMWGELFARGIVDPIDDFRDSNPPSNSELLDWLAEQFVSHHFDRKHMLRIILNSRTYQASYRAPTGSEDGPMYFSHQEPRLLSAEQLLDAINQVTGLADPLGSLPESTRATQLPATDLVKLDFLKVFGQPERASVCACERAVESNLGMAIEFFNGPFIHQKLRNEKNRFRLAMADGKSDPEIIADLYMVALSRAPEPVELELAQKQIALRGDRAAGLEDICWALLNTDEFLFQH